MAYSAKEWEVVRAFFESGLSLSEIVARKEVAIKDRGGISRRARAEGWVKGGYSLDAQQKNISITSQRPANCLYVITADEFAGVYKIGIAFDVDKRLSQMQTGCPYRLYAVSVHYVNNPLDAELMLHSYFFKKKVRGEWFRLSDTDLEFISEVMENIDAVILEKKVA